MDGHTKVIAKEFRRRKSTSFFANALIPAFDFFLLRILSLQLFRDA